MRNSRKSTFTILVCALVTLLFTNCDNNAENTELFNSLNTACGSENCNEVNPGGLEVQINSPDGLVVPNVSEINIGGLCNDGGYPFNQVKWFLIPEGSNVAIADSSALNNASQKDLSGTCENGRFILLIRFPQTTGIDSAHRLKVQIYGKFELGETADEFTNDFGAGETIDLLP